MTVFFGSDYVTQINDLVFTPTGGQFGPDVTGFNYDEFFGVGEDELVGDSFSIGGPVIVDLPFVGETEVFRGRLFGELGAQFGIQVTSTLDPGSVDAVLPYQTIVAFPDVIAANAVDGDVLDVFFSNEFRPQDAADSGFTTEFPSFTFDLGLVTELVVKLAAEVGALGDSETLQILDFTVPETIIPILSVDTNRTITAQDVADDPTLSEGDFNPVEIFGDTTPELIDNAGLDPAFNDAGELTGIGIPLNTFVSGPDAPDPDTVDASPQGDEVPDSDPGFDLSSIDLGSIEIFVPNINTVSSFVEADGIFVTDPSRKAIYNRDGSGNLTSIDRVDDLDDEGNNLNEGNRDDVVRLTLDLDGLITYATGGTFPPLELGPLDILDGSILGIVDLDAGFSYNLLDVELEAALPLEQEFTLTPRLETQFKFFEAEADGSKGAEKFVDVRLNQKVLNFDQSGTFQNAALEARLQQLAESNATFAQDVSLFIDFNDGVPGAFTGATASLGGAMMISRDGGATFQRLGVEDTDPIAFSAPALGQDQNADLTLDDQTVLAYRLFIGSGSAEVQEDYIIEFDKTDTIFVEEVREVTTPISETPFLEELDALNLVYDADDTFVEVVTKSTPTVTNRTGLEFDLALLLSGLEASATFDASVDIGPITIGTGLEFNLGPLFEEKFELLNLDIVDLFNGSFNLEQEQVQSFVLGESASTDFGDAIVGTSGNDTLDGTAGDDEIIALAGADTIDAGAGNDTIFLGAGTDTIDGGAGNDTLDLSDLGGSASANAITRNFGSLVLELQAPGERLGLLGSSSGSTVKGVQFEFLVSSFDQVTGTGSSHRAANVERVILSDFGEQISLGNGEKPEVWETGAGRDRVFIHNGNHDPFTLRTGDDDDVVEVFLSPDLTGSTLDGGAGHDYLSIDSSIDLEAGIGPGGATYLSFESVAAFTDDAGSQTFRGTDGANTLDGQSGADILFGRGGNDLLIGGNDNDTLFGGAGADSMVGGAGLDTASYADSSTSVFIDLDFGGTARGFRGEAQGDTFSSVEQIIGSDFDDILIGDNSSVTLSGGEGDDRLQSQNGGDLLLGGDGDDLLNRGTTATLGGTFNNVFDGGDGFDLVAVDIFDQFNQTGTATGTASYTYRTGTQPFDSTTTVDKNVTIDFRYLRTAHVELTLDETGSGTIEYVEEDATDRVFATGLSGTAEYSSRNEPTIIPIPPFIIPDLTFDVRTSNFDYNITAKRYANIIDDGISFSKVSEDDFNDVNGSGKVTNIGNPSVSSGGVFGTEQVINVEGLIGSQGNDRLTGNSQNNAFFGNGGDDLIKAGGGDDRLGFGEGQALTDVFSFPGFGTGAGSVGGGSDPRVFVNLEQRLKALDPNGTGIDQSGLTGISTSGNTATNFEISEASVVPVGKIELNASGATQDVGSFLWGQGGDDTLDLRFDRGIDFFPVISDTRAIVDLDIATASSPINNFTGTVIEYGRASYVDAEGTELNFATTFGVDNVIGTGNADTITGDRNNNSIEGGDGADLLDGDDGFDTLSYALADEGVTLNFRDDGALMVMDNGRETITGAGDATGDVASNFELVLGTDHDDTVVLDSAAATGARTFGASFQAPISVQIGTTGFPAFNPIFTTQLRTFSDTFQLQAVNNTAIAPELDLGAGDDDVTATGTRRQNIDLGDGNDTASLENSGHTVFGGAGDDTITIQTTVDLVYQNNAQQRTVIDGGDDVDTVIFNGPRWNSLTLNDGVAIVTQGANAIVGETSFTYADPQFGSRTVNFGGDDQVQQARLDAFEDGGGRYELTNVEFVEINGQRIRIDNPDPIVDADKTLNLIEDQIDAYDMGLSIPGTDIDAGATFEIIELPTTAFLQTPGGVFLSVGDTVSATDMAGLQVVPGQNFDPAADKFTYLRTGDAPEDALSKQLPDTVRGVALNITSHLTEETIETVAELPAAPTVALAGLNPGLDVGDLPLAEALNYAQQADLDTMPTGAMTYELLFRSFGPLDPDGPDQVFASYAVTGSNNEFLIYGYKDGRGLEISYNGVRIETGVRTDTLYDREMHRLSVTVDPDANKMQLLIDGVLMFDQDITINGGIDTGGFFIIGQEQDSAPGDEDGFNENQTLSGEIGDVRIWNGVRTEAEVAATAFAEVSDPGLAANWRADTTNQGVMVDVVGGEHLALINAPDVVEAPLPDGPRLAVIDTVMVNTSPATNQHIQSLNTPMPTSDLTVEFVMQGRDLSTEFDARQHFLSYAVAESDNELLLFADGTNLDGEINIFVAGNDVFNTGLDSSLLFDGQAHRVSITLDTTNGVLAFYVDGEQVFSGNASGTLDLTTGGSLNFGQEQDTVGGVFDPGQIVRGDFGDIRLWDTVRTAEEIAQTAFFEIPDPAATANLVANWQVDTTNTASVVDVLGGPAMVQAGNPAFGAVAFPVSTHVEALVSLNAGGVTDQYIAATNVALPTGDISLEWYYNAPDPIVLDESDFLTFLSYATDTNQNQMFVFAFDNDFGDTIFINLGGTGFDTGIPLTALTEGGPHRISITVDTAADELIFYIDGEAVFTGKGSDVGLGNPIAGNAAGGTLIFGQEQDELGGGFQTSDILIGEVGDIRIWNDVRTPSEVAANAFLEFVNADEQDGLVANWQADVATPSELPDAVGGPAMTVQNAAPIVSETFPTDGDTSLPAPEVTTTTQIVDQQGDPVTIRVEEVPTDGTVFFMAPDPTLLAMGITFDVEVPVAVGDELTPAQLEGLFFRADDNFTGDPGSFRYSVTDDVSFRQLSATFRTDVDNRTDGAENDGSASQTITFDVAPVNDAPTIGNVLFPISPGAEFESTVRVVDTEDDDFTVALTKAPTFGTVVVNPDGSFTYQQNAVIDFAGAAFIEDVFEVTATETASGSFFSNVEPASSGPQRQVIRIINPDLATDIVFDETDAGFFDDEGNPINIGGLATDDVIIGHSGKDGLFGFGGHDTVSGREDDDLLFGGTGNDTLNGEAGNDTLVGEEGDDTLDGGEGFDVADYSAESSAITVTLSSANAFGAAAGDRFIDVEGVIGTDFNDILNGDAAGNLLKGGSGNDTLNGLAGADTMEGGAGNDRFFVDDIGDVVVELAGEGTDTVTTSVSITMAENVENASTSGSAAVDITGNALNNFITGNAESNVLKGEDGNDRLQGQAGDDTLEGGRGNDILEGQIGSDVLKFGVDAGNDTAFGFELGLDKLDFTELGLRFVQLSFIESAGSTRVEYDNGLGGTASVNLQGVSLTQITSDIMVDPSGLGSPGGGVPLFEGDTGNNDLFGDFGSVAEDFVGGQGNDRFFGFGGDDTMVGGFGDDRYFVTDAGDVVIEQDFQGIDQVDTTISLTLGDGIERGAVTGDNAVDITGNDLDNFITGSDQTNVLLGGGGRDRLIARGGDDTLNGGTDRDVLEGGDGADVFVFEADSGIDLITDFEVGVDRIDISALGIAYADMRIQDGPLGAQVFLDLTPGSVDLITLNGVSGSELLLDSFITAFGANQPPIVGTPGNDNLTGSQIGDELQGLGGNDLVNGAGGADTMIGGDGDDTYTVDNAGDVVVELPGEGSDRVNARVDVALADNVENGSAVFGTGPGGVSEDIDLTGNALDNALTGNDANNVLLGLDGADNLQGVDGADTLNGGTGNDILRGGLDADTFVFDNGDGADQILDFEIGTDTIDLSATGLSFGDLTIQSQGANALVQYGADSILFQNTDAGLLSSSDFDFGP